MREILFRGKRTDNGEWWYGLPLRTLNKNGEDILNIQCWERDEEGVTGIYESVVPETVGEYTGLTDKNGTKIFEGDILKGSWETILTIFFDEISSSYRVKTSTGHEREPSYYGVDKWEVVGNVYDTPELLKGEGR